MTLDLSWVTYQDNIANQILWFDSIGDIFKPLKEIANDSSTTILGTNVCQITTCPGCLRSRPCTIQDIAAAPMIKLPQTTNYTWVDQKSGLTLVR